MSKALYLLIDACDACPYFRRVGIYADEPAYYECNFGGMCKPIVSEHEVLRVFRQGFLPSPFQIPDWCKLRDATEQDRELIALKMGM